MLQKLKITHCVVVKLKQEKSLAAVLSRLTAQGGLSLCLNIFIFIHHSHLSLPQTDLLELCLLQEQAQDVLVPPLL